MILSPRSHSMFNLLILLIIFSASWFASASPNSCTDWFSPSAPSSTALVPVKINPLPVKTGESAEGLSGKVLDKIYSYLLLQDSNSTSMTHMNFTGSPWHDHLLGSRTVQALLGKKSFSILQNFPALPTQLQHQIATKTAATLFELFSSPESEAVEAMKQRGLSIETIQSFSQWWFEVGKIDPQINVFYIMSHLHELSERLHNSSKPINWIRRFRFNRKNKMISISQPIASSFDQFVSQSNQPSSAEDLILELRSPEALWLIYNLTGSELLKEKIMSLSYHPSRNINPSPELETTFGDSHNDQKNQLLIEAKLAERSAILEERLKLNKKAEKLKAELKAPNDEYSNKRITNILDYIRTYTNKWGHRQYEYMENSIIRIANILRNIPSADLTDSEKFLILGRIFEKMSIISRYNNPQWFIKSLDKHYGSIRNYNDTYHIIQLLYKYIHHFSGSDEALNEYLKERIEDLFILLPPLAPESVVESGEISKEKYEKSVEAYNRLMSLRNKLAWNFALNRPQEPTLQEQIDAIDVQYLSLAERLKNLDQQIESIKSGYAVVVEIKEDTAGDFYADDPLTNYLQQWISSGGRLQLAEFHLLQNGNGTHADLAPENISHSRLDNYTTDLRESFAHLMTAISNFQILSTEQRLSNSRLLPQSPINSDLSSSFGQFEINRDRLDSATSFRIVDELHKFKVRAQSLLESATTRRAHLESMRGQLDGVDQDIKLHLDQKRSELNMIIEQSQKLVDYLQAAKESMLALEIH